MSLVCVGSFPGHPGFKGLGELSPDELASLLDTRRPVSEAQYSLAELAWQAFREPTPEALDNLRHADTAAAVSRERLSRASSRSIPGRPTASLAPSAGS